MIRFIAALDEDKGIANDAGIPWQGKLPTDVAYFREKTLHGNLMMGMGWYNEQLKPLPERRNLVANPEPMQIRNGFEQVTDAREFLQNAKEDIWVGGGAMLFESTLDLADELYLTRLSGTYGCTKFFPDFENFFQLQTQSEPQTENGITFTFQVWAKMSGV